MTNTAPREAQRQAGDDHHLLGPARQACCSRRGIQLVVWYGRVVGLVPRPLDGVGVHRVQNCAGQWGPNLAQQLDRPREVLTGGTTGTTDQQGGVRGCG